MTRRSGRSADNDPGLAALLDAGAPVVCMVGKSWDYHVTDALGIELDENVAMIADSVRYARTKVEEVMFDAEHFFDGYKANPEYALDCARSAYEAGARWIVLCDTNGGTLPHEVEEIVGAVARAGAGRAARHPLPQRHRQRRRQQPDGGAAGARQIQGTLNGLGERCGNADLVAIVPTLALKMGFSTRARRRST